MSDSTAEKVISEKKFLSLLRHDRNEHARVQSINGARGVELKAARDDNNLHIQAFKHIAKLLRMDEEKRNDFIRAVKLYFGYAVDGGLIQAHVGDLFDEDAGIVRETAKAADPDISGDPAVDLDREAAERNAEALNGGIKQLEADEFDDATSSSPPSSRPRGRPRKNPLEGAEAPGSYKHLDS